MSDIRVLAVDPYNPVSGLLIPQLTQRIMECARIQTPEMPAETVASQAMVSIWARDPSALLIALVDDQGVVHGHAYAHVVQAPGVPPYVMVGQCRADGTKVDQIGAHLVTALRTIEAWARPLGAVRMVVTTGKADSMWKSQGGFVTQRRTLIREFGQPEAAARPEKSDGPAEVIELAERVAQA
jgi:hypothetical protein